MKIMFDEMKAHDVIEEGYEEAKNYIESTKKMDALIDKVTMKLNEMDDQEDFSDYVSNYILLLSDYRNKRYTEMPNVALLVMVSSLLYLVNRYDYIPDDLGDTGLYDDKLVIKVCQRMIESEMNDYNQWRKNNG